MVGIAVISFNHFVFTKRCVESILNYTKAGTYKLCLIDNGSWDQTKQWAKSLEKDGLLTFIDNEKNLGACKAANQGKIWALEDSVIRDVVIMANDHIVSKDWLLPFEDVMIDYANPFTFFSNKYFIGLDSVVNREFANKHRRLRTKYFQNQEREEDLDKVIIDLYGNYDDFVEKFKSRHFDKRYIPTRVSKWTGLTFYRRYVIEEVGLKDEEFLKYSLAGYADVDYQLRCSVAGFKFYVAMQSYAHHWGSITMRKTGLVADETFNKGKLGQTDRAGARKYFKKKWGSLIPGKILEKHGILKINQEG